MTGQTDTTTMILVYETHPGESLSPALDGLTADLRRAALSVQTRRQGAHQLALYDLRDARVALLWAEDLDGPNDACLIVAVDCPGGDSGPRASELARKVASVCPPDHARLHPIDGPLGMARLEMLGAVLGQDTRVSRLVPARALASSARLPARRRPQGVIAAMLAMGLLLAPFGPAAAPVAPQATAPVTTPR